VTSIIAITISPAAHATTVPTRPNGAGGTPPAASPWNSLGDSPEVSPVAPGVMEC
jgi:hypothetical protein